MSGPSPATLDGPAAATDPLGLPGRADRRFNRSRVDAERAVEAFAGSVRDEVDLRLLRGAVVGTSRAAVAPSFAWVWLRGDR